MDEVKPAEEETGKKKTSFVDDIFKLVSGTAIAQILMALASPVITRLFSPDDLGFFALFSSITGIFASILCLRYDLAIMLPKKNSDAANLLAGSLYIAGFVTLLTVPMIWFGGVSLSNLLNAPEIIPYLWWIPLALFFGGIGAGHPALNAWASRERRFKLISYTRILGALVTILIQLAYGFAGMNSGGSLIIGGLVGSILSPLLLVISIWRQDHPLFLSSVNGQSLRENLLKYKKFPAYNTFSALLNTISWQIPSFLLSFYFSTTIVGYYALGSQLLRVPMNLIGGSIGQVFHSHAADAFHEGKLAEFVETTFRRLVEYSFLPILILAVVGRELFVVLFGVQWAEAGIYTQILSFWMFFWFISSPLSRLYGILNRNEYSLIINMAILISRIFSIWLGWMMNSPRMAIMFFSISGAFVYGFLSISILVISGVSWRNIGKTLFSNLVLFFPTAAFLVMFKMFVITEWIRVMMAAALVGAYFLYRLKTTRFETDAALKIYFFR